MNKPIYVNRPTTPDLEKVVTAMTEIWDNCYFTNNGPFHQKLEKQLATLLKTDHLSLFSNGTLALMIAMKALKLTGEVIVTPFTFPATVSAISWCGLTPVFCDIKPDTMCLDPEQIEKHITDKTSAILGVHVYGIPCDVYKIQETADHHHLKVIYDAAHSFLSEIDEKPVSDFGDISMFSFHATKIFQTLEGGAITFNDPILKDTADKMKNFGYQTGVPVLSGINAKMNEVQAAVGLATLDKIDEQRQNRQKISDIYDDFLQNKPGIETFSHLSNSLQYYPIRVNSEQAGLSRDDINTRLKQDNIFGRAYFWPLCSDIPDYSHLPTADHNNLPVAARVTEEILCLPFYGDLLEDGLDRICHSLEAILSQPTTQKAQSQ